MIPPWYQKNKLDHKKRGENPPANNLESSFGTVRSFVLCPLFPRLFCGGSAIDARGRAEKSPLVSLSFCCVKAEEEGEESADQENNGEKEKRKFDKKEKD